MKLFDKLTNLKMPSKLGKNNQELEGNFEYKYYLVFSELEDAPTFELETSLSVGSEVGDIVIEDETISPRHCTFTLNQDVISVLDHNSEYGTFIGKKAIDPSKMYILQETDKIYIGDILVEIELEAVEIEAPMIEATSEINVEEILNESQEDIKEEFVEEEPQSPPKELQLENTGTLEIENIDFEQLTQKHQEEVNVENEKENLQLTKVKKEKREVSKDKTKRFNISAQTPNASSSLIRLIAIFADVLITFIIYFILSPFDEFRIFLQEVPSSIAQLIGPFYNEELAPVVNAFLEDYPALIEFGKDSAELWSSDYQGFLNGFILFGLIRVFSTLLLGVSIGQMLIGVKSYGNIFVKRIMGMIREVIGLFTGPFIIFDIATLFNFRSVKELITFTRIYTPSLIKSTLLSVLSLSALILLLMISPLFQGLDFREAHVVNSTGILKIKDFDFDETFNTSKYFGFRANISEDFKVLPMFSFKKVDTKLLAEPSIKFLNLKTKKEINVEKDKTFDLRKFLKVAFNLNYFAQSTFPELFKYLNDVSENNTSFKMHKFDDAKIANEFQMLIESSMQLDILTVIDHIFSYGPFIKGFIDFRDSFLNLVDGNVENINIEKIGDSYFAVLSIENPRKFHIKMLPLIVDSNTIYEVSAEKKGISFKKVQELFKKTSFRKENLEKIKNINYFSLIDQLMLQNSSYDADFYQQIYELIFSDLKNAFSDQDEFLILKWEFSLTDFIKFIEKFKLTNQDEQVNWQKMYQNLNDLLRAIRDKDSNFFGISTLKKV